MPTAAPITVKREGTPTWLYNALRRLADGQVQTQRGFAAIIRGEAPDGTGSTLINLADYFFKPGLPGGQIARGSTGAAGLLSFSSTAHSTKGFIYLGLASPRFAFDETNARVGIGTDTPQLRLHLKSTATVSEFLQRYELPGTDIVGCVSNGTATVTGSSLFASIAIGMLVTGSLVPANTTVTGWTSSSSITLSNTVTAGTSTMTFSHRADLGISAGGEWLWQGSAALNLVMTGGITPTAASGLRLVAAGNGAPFSNTPRGWVQFGPTNLNGAFTGMNATNGTSLHVLFSYTTFNTWGGVGTDFTTVARVGINVDPYDYSSSLVTAQPGSLLVARMASASAAVPTVLVEGASSTSPAISVRSTSGGSRFSKSIDATDLGGIRHDGKIMLCGGGTNGLLDGSGPAQMTVTDTSNNVFLRIGQVGAWSDGLVAGDSRYVQFGYLSNGHRAVLVDSSGHGVFTRFGVSTQYFLISNGQAGGAQFPAPDGSGSPSVLRVYNAATGGFDASVVCKIESARTGQSGDLLQCISVVTGNTTFLVDKKAFLQASIKSNSFFVDSTDLTKKLALTLSGILTATTRTWTVQDASGTVPLLEVANVFTQQQTMPTIKLTTGASAGKVLQSDASGVGSWVDPPSSIPSGVIVMWYGSIATVPSGWYLCDGANGTPDLRDKFIVGAKQDDSGVAKTNVSESLTQSGGASTHTHAAHAYTPTGTVDVAGPNAPYIGRGTGASLVPTTVHTHDATFTGDAASLTHDSPSHLPPYYALAYIMKA
jgi:hypothetical protein